MSAAVAHQTGIDQTSTASFEKLAGRSSTLLPLLLSGAAALGGLTEAGTTVVHRHDYRPVIASTRNFEVRVEGPMAPFATPTRMALIRGLAPLSLREWAAVFGVSHSAVKQWADGEEPNRDKLDRVLGALNEASGYHADLARWLTSALPGMEIRPLDLLRNDRWRAFKGAIRTRTAPAVTETAEELQRRRRNQVSWAVPEPPTIADDA
jgi:hypothetical protein